MSDHIARVIDEASEAVNYRVRLNKKASETLDVPLDAGDKKAMAKQLKAYERQLQSLRRALASKSKNQIAKARKRIFESYAARLIATVRATRNERGLVPYVELEKRGEQPLPFQSVSRDGGGRAGAGEARLVAADCSVRQTPQGTAIHPARHPAAHHG
jgi:hypothetical protein